MKFAKLFLLMLGIALITFSCKKDDDGGNDPQQDQSYLTIKTMNPQAGSTIETSTNLNVEVEYKIVDSEWVSADAHQLRLMYWSVNDSWAYVGDDWGEAVTQQSGSITKTYDVGRLKNMTYAAHPFKMVFKINGSGLDVASDTFTFN